MIVSRVTDLDRVALVLFDEEIFSRISEDGIDRDSWTIPSDPIYIMDEANTSLMIYHWQNSVTLECHVHVLKDYRKNALDFGQSALNWAWQNTNAVKIVAQIPEIYPDVLKFSLKNGFELEGLNQSSYLKDGELYDQVYVGLVRNGLCT